MTKLAVVSGSAGFIGHNLVKGLLESGYDVIGFDKNSHINTDFIGEHDNEFRFVTADCRKPESYDYIIEMADIVYHLAGQVDVRKSIEDPFSDFDNNVMGSYAMVNLCLKHDTKMIFTSSFAVYGNTGSPVPETQKLNPISPYGTSKALVEMIINSYRRIFGLNATVLRLTNVYGPMSYKGVIYKFLRAVMEGKPVTVNGTGNQKRDFIFVQDVVEAIMKSANAPNGTYNIGTGKPTSINDVMNIIKSFGYGLDIIDKDKIKGEIEKIWADTTFTEKTMKWKAKTPLKDGMSKLHNFLSEGA